MDRHQAGPYPLRFATLSKRCRGVVVAALCCWSILVGPTPAPAADTAALQQALARLETGANGRLGLAMLDTDSGQRFQYRGQERFPLCSTFKLFLAAAVLQKSLTDPGLLQKNIPYQERDLLSYAPVTRRNLETGMTVAALCEAALTVSDNTAANLLLRELGGPAAVNAFARSIGDTTFRLDRIEPDLNTAVPGDSRDTTTPEAMARSLDTIALGKALGPSQRAQLVEWLKANTTGAASIRAGAPEGWIIGDKTGSGAYGTTNDVAILWPPQGKPLVLAVYFTQHTKDAKARRDVLAEATRLVLTRFFPAPTN